MTFTLGLVQPKISQAVWVSPSTQKHKDRAALGHPGADAGKVACVELSDIESEAARSLMRAHKLTPTPLPRGFCGPQAPSF